jgi:hypothetical protein
MLPLLDLPLPSDLEEEDTVSLKEELTADNKALTVNLLSNKLTEDISNNNQLMELPLLLLRTDLNKVEIRPLRIPIRFSNC